MITDHVPAARLPPDNTVRLLAASVPARGGVEDRRDLDPAPPARRPAASSGAPTEAELGGPGLAALLSVIPKARRNGLRMLIPDTVLRWHRDIVRHRWASRSMSGKTGRSRPSGSSSSASPAPGYRPGRLSCSSHASGRSWPARTTTRPAPSSRSPAAPRARWPSSSTSTARNSPDAVRHRFYRPISYQGQRCLLFTRGRKVLPLPSLGGVAL